MKLLAIETATEACSAALFLDGDVRERYQVAPREHGDLILPMIESLLQEAGVGLSQLDALAFGRGPGSFTGVRMATGVIQGLAFSIDLPVVPVSTLAALAQSIVDRCALPRIYAALDARMGEVYWGAYQIGPDGLVALQGEEHVLPPAAVTALGGQHGVAVGHGWRTYRDVMLAAMGGTVDACYADQLPRAAGVALLAESLYHKGLSVPAEQALPVYLRDNVAKVKADQ